MKYGILGRTGLKVSRIGLGTAEIGFAYGIGPRTLPSEEEAISFLKAAVDLGVTYFDTAYFYGLAEERIGKSDILKNSNTIVATKCGQFLEAGEDPRGLELEQRLRDQVEVSLRKMRVDSVPILILHGGSKEQLKRGELIMILRKFKVEGKAKHIGISTRGEEASIAAIESDFFDVVQVAFSILDQRMTKKVLPLALEKNIGVICRSVLLKGALTELANNLPKSLAWLKINSFRAGIIAEDELDCDLPTLAIRFALSQPVLSTVLVGTNKIQNLQKAVSLVEKNHLPRDIISKLEKLAVDDLMQVDPFRWKSSVSAIATDETKEA